MRPAQEQVFRMITEVLAQSQAGPGPTLAGGCERFAAELPSSSSTPGSALCRRHLGPGGRGDDHRWSCSCGCPTTSSAIGSGRQYAGVMKRSSARTLCRPNPAGASPLPPRGRDPAQLPASAGPPYRRAGRPSARHGAWVPAGALLGQLSPTAPALPTVERRARRPPQQEPHQPLRATFRQPGGRPANQMA